MPVLVKRSQQGNFVPSPPRTACPALFGAIPQGNEAIPQGNELDGIFTPAGGVNGPPLPGS